MKDPVLIDHYFRIFGAMYDERGEVIMEGKFVERNLYVKRDDLRDSITILLCKGINELSAESMMSLDLMICGTCMNTTG